MQDAHPPWGSRAFFPPRAESVANEEMGSLEVTCEKNLVQHLHFMSEEVEVQRGMH